ncbi:putative nuclease HARBI1 [Orchesella cincta]|uniref:Putative nuclease HARBI1 n=1 Tax=Orchesella cincta TaxID=48709 RepID=A0A1D2NKJ6_ORCCI|nr:putative nuclease HARBI1 [Orchesella cincta]
MKAILAKEKEWIFWPNCDERKRIRYFMSDKLPGCIGYIDGSHITLDEAPVDDPESYFNRKQNYAIQLQAVCDNDKRIRNLTVGYPGSVHDARVFANSSIATSHNYFDEGEWIAGDSAYANTKFLVTPFKSNTAGVDDQRRKQFNRYFSGFRVNIECCFGSLKEIFQSLKGLRVRVDKKNGHRLACNWITACCVLYNMILPSLEFDLSRYEYDESVESTENHSELEHEQQRSDF